MIATVAPLRSGTDREVNLAAVRRAVGEAADEGARLVVLPEYASWFDPRGVGPEQAETLDGAFVAGVRETAAAGSLTVVVGTVVPGRTAQRAVNAVVVAGPDGDLAVYRKVHLYDAFGQRESDRFEAGDPAAQPVVVDVDGVLVGVMTCYDLRFPESARRLVDAGATALAVPAAWADGPHKADQWRTLLRARAVENCCYVLAAAQQGPGVTGTSLVVDPLGVVVAESGTGGAEPSGPGLPAAPSAVTATVDPGVVAGVRERNPSLLNRRYRVVPTGDAPAPPSGRGADRLP